MKVSKLREATAADHEAVENAVPLMDPGLNVARYGAVLWRMHGVVAAWEEFAEVAAPGDLKEMVRARQRRGLLEGDLHALGLGVPVGKGPGIPAWGTLAELLGAMYVIEGSRLGGQMIARHAEEVLGFAPGSGDAYFRGFEGKTGAMWRELVGILEMRVSVGEEEEAIRAAREMFGLFGEWMRGGDSDAVVDGE